MTVLLVLLTFLAFAVIDYALNRGKFPRRVVEKPHTPALNPVAEAARAAIMEPAVTWVDGFAVPDRMRYHPGHAWCLTERKGIERVGVDDFAARLAGRIDSIELPRPGQWLRQGQKAWSFTRDGERTEMASPVEGEVLQINEEVLRDPSLLRHDPYGSGWLMTMEVPDAENTARNLIPKGMVSMWMRQAVEAFYGMQPQLAGVTAADGGQPVDDLCIGLPQESWSRLTREFFLTR
ncbi:MAG TPA: glycine cleavage system protein H [Bryobacteraceae bacterium]|nr:glycine cleavage system protein H [Bryobacteraceae bacterium]